MEDSMDDEVLAIVEHRAWFKSSYSSGSCSCVEVCFEPDAILIRDSKYRRGSDVDLAAEPIIKMSVRSWLTFLDEVTGLAAVGSNGELLVEQGDDGSATFQSVGCGTELAYTADEIDAFVAGVVASEFIPDMVPV